MTTTTSHRSIPPPTAGPTADPVPDEARAPVAEVGGGQVDEDLSGLEAPPFLGNRPRSRWLSISVRISVPILLLVGWWVGSASGFIPKTILASPAEVWNALVEIQHTGQLRTFLTASILRAAVGVGVGVTIGLLLGLASGLSALGEELVDPTMQMLRAVPFLALIPLFISWFGIDETFKVVLIASATAFPMYAYAYLGVRNVDKKVIEAARGFGLRRRRLITEVILPAALPNLLMALRICLAISLTALIAAEAVGTEVGIGYLVLLAKQYFRPDYMVLCILLYAFLGLVFDVFVRLLERYATPWRRHSVVR